MVLNFIKKKAFVVSTHLGTTGGGALAPYLLCEELSAMGLEVTAFAQNLIFNGRKTTDSFSVVTPMIRRGCRWDIPGRILSRQVVREAGRRDPEFIFMCGLTQLARHLLCSETAGRLLVWEFTNATPGNRMVDTGASQILGRCRCVLSPSSTIDKRIRASYGYTGLIERLPFWVEEQALDEHNRTDGEREDFIYLGRRDREKGLMELIAATAKVAASYPGVKVLITGPGSDEMYRVEAAKTGAEENVSFRFFANYKDTLKALVRARCLVLPSFHEGYPLVLLEAAQFGIPFIATSVGSVAEVFEGTGAGIIIPPRNADALAEAMLKILEETESQRFVRGRAARRVFDQVSSKKVVRENLERVLRAIQ